MHFRGKQIWGLKNMLQEIVSTRVKPKPLGGWHRWHYRFKLNCICSVWCTRRTAEDQGGIAYSLDRSRQFPTSFVYRVQRNKMLSPLHFVDLLTVGRTDCSRPMSFVDKVARRKERDNDTSHELLCILFLTNQSWKKSAEVMLFSNSLHE